MCLCGECGSGGHFERNVSLRHSFCILLRRTFTTCHKNYINTRNLFILKVSKLACSKLHNSLCRMPLVFSCRHSGLNISRSLFRPLSSLFTTKRRRKIFRGGKAPRRKNEGMDKAARPWSESGGISTRHSSLDPFFPTQTLPSFHQACIYKNIWFQFYIIHSNVFYTYVVIYAFTSKWIKPSSNETW